MDGNGRRRIAGRVVFGAIAPDGGTIAAVSYREAPEPTPSAGPRSSPRAAIVCAVGPLKGGSPVQGGTGTVYLAEDLKRHRPVAVKVLRPELAAALGPERFLREVEILARLDHSHILPLLDFGEADGFLF